MADAQKAASLGPLRRGIDRLRVSRSSAPPVSAAESLDRLAVLLEAGVAPASALGHAASVAETAYERRILELARDLVADGSRGSNALVHAVHRLTDRGARVRTPADATAEWLQAAAAWRVAEVSGAALAPALRTSAEASRSLVQARRDTRVALSGPVATSRIVLALPAVGVAMASLVGIDSLGVLLRSPPGWMCGGAAAGLVALARGWNRHLIAVAAPPAGIGGLDLELLAAALAGGGGWVGARARVADALEECCPGAAVLTPAKRIDALESLSISAGVPAASLLRGSAESLRREARSEAAVASERLGVRLLLPLGVCVLPAFLLVGVAPLMIALLSSTGLE